MKKLLKNQTQVMIEKVIKKNLDKLCLKWESYDNSCNGLIDKKTKEKSVNILLKQINFMVVI